MPTRNIVLTQRQAELIESLVESGRYQNASEVLREGLRLVESREAQDHARLEALRKAVKVGLDDLRESRYRGFDSFEALDDHVGKIADRAIAKHRTNQKRK
jgi:antitoxin ParD1/3/4